MQDEKSSEGTPDFSATILPQKFSGVLLGMLPERKRQKYAGQIFAAGAWVRFLDTEDLFFPKTGPRYLFSTPRSRAEVKALLLREICKQESLVFAEVKMTTGKILLPIIDIL
jgi:hypothetical protein